MDTLNELITYGLSFIASCLLLVYALLVIAETRDKQADTCKQFTSTTITNNR